MTTKGKVGLWTSLILLLGLSIFVYIKFYFVYSEGVNEGDINYFQKEGFVFKTYEGKMIQTGYNSKNSNATIQSNEFRFSVDDSRIANQIESGSTSQIKLHWHRYLGTLPWRGKSEYIVDSIISVKPSSYQPKKDDILDLPID
ncbi:MAG: hypothetical protein J6Y00_03220 [Paludibacteraceae bacterium]|nr:hypothetical protein [Paludibacteraceae bacterium]